MYSSRNILIRFFTLFHCFIWLMSVHCRINAFESWILNQPLIQVQIKVNIKAPRHWPLWREFTGDRWIPRTKDQLREKWFHLMTSSWVAKVIGYSYMPSYVIVTKVTSWAKRPVLSHFMTYEIRSTTNIWQVSCVCMNTIINIQHNVVYWDPKQSSCSELIYN